ncbi:hypothetical protein P7K49_013315 [Saguinus oedipus]|uniref:Uncharacterized protein n=1 Tax=Saguinus oedipus TaxID=9490 RepID=A0ABQ9VGD9_SAGOE|nr:hypothetical protein P7K49_013315 [Saguinus oedipus]
MQGTRGGSINAESGAMGAREAAPSMWNLEPCRAPESAPSVRNWAAQGSSIGAEQTLLGSSPLTGAEWTLLGGSPLTGAEWTLLGGSPLTGAEWTLLGGSIGAEWTLLGGSIGAEWTLLGGSIGAEWTLLGGSPLIGAEWTLFDGSPLTGAEWTLLGGSIGAERTLLGGSPLISAEWTLLGGSPLTGAEWTLLGGSPLTARHRKPPGGSSRNAQCLDALLSRPGPASFPGLHGLHNLALQPLLCLLSFAIVALPVSSIGSGRNRAWSLSSPHLLKSLPAGFSGHRLVLEVAVTESKTSQGCAFVPELWGSWDSAGVGFSASVSSSSVAGG